MGHGSPLPAKLHERIVSQFKDNVSQRKIANNLGLSLSTFRNIVKSFKKSLEILVRKGQGWKPLLNARDHRALRRYHATMMDITTWAWEYFGKSLSLNTVRRCMKKCNLKLYYAKRKAFVNFVQKRHECSWPEVIWNGPKDGGNMLFGQTTFQFVFGKNGCRIRAKDEKDHPDCCQRKVQKPASVMVWGCISTQGMGDLHICEGTIDVEAYVGILERYMLPSRWQLFPGTPWLFQQNNGRPHSAWQRGFIGIECVWLTGLPAVQICLLLENQTEATTDFWAAQVLLTPRMGKNLTCKTATIDIFSSQTITKCKKTWCYPVVNMSLSQFLLCVAETNF